jgi:hypothetical protein
VATDLAIRWTSDLAKFPSQLRDCSSILHGAHTLIHGLNSLSAILLQYSAQTSNSRCNFYPIYPPHPIYHTTRVLPPSPLPHPRLNVSAIREQFFSCIVLCSTYDIRASRNAVLIPASQSFASMPNSSCTSTILTPRCSAMSPIRPWPTSLSSLYSCSNLM